MNVDKAFSENMDRLDELLDDDAIENEAHYLEISPELFLKASLEDEGFYSSLKGSGANVDKFIEMLDEALKQEKRTAGTTKMSGAVQIGRAHV